MSNTERLTEILTAITDIEAIVAEGRDAFFQNRNSQNAVLYSLIVIGEATNKLEDSFKAVNPTVLWGFFYQYRNFVAHGYMHVNVARLWSTIVEDVVELRQFIEGLS